MRAESKDGRVQASHVLKSYLDALQIPYTAASCGVELAIKSRSEDSEVRVSLRQDATNAVVDGVVEVNALDVVSPKIDRVLQALHSVTEAAGYGRPDPIARGKAPEDRITYHDAFEDVYLRGVLLYRTPNPSAEGMKKVLSYMPIIKRAAGKALFRFKNPLTSMGFAEQDLVDVGIMHTIAFLHNYAYDPIEVNNIKLLTEYLNQRFGELAKVTSKKGSNSAFVAISATRAHGGTRSHHEDDYDRFAGIMADLDEESSSPEEDYESGEYWLTSQNGERRSLEARADGFMGVELYLEGRRLTSSERTVLKDRIASGELTLDDSSIQHTKGATDEDKGLSANVRKNRARKELYTRLSTMTPEQRETVLSYASLSRDYCPDARAMARKLCEELHCPNCDRRVASGTRCFKCEIEAVPRFGIDFVGYRTKLRDERHSLADSMTASIPDSELRARKRRTSPTSSVAPEAVTAVVSPPVPTISKEEVAALAKKLADECFNALPANLTCTHCRLELPKASFGVRVPRCKKTGMPQKASKIPWCKKCRKEAK